MASESQQKTSFPRVLNLNVGGQIYTTSLSTLTKYSESMLGAMFSGRFPVEQDSNGNYFIDRDGALFRYVLEFLRNGELQAPENLRESRLLLKEAEFFQIPVLIQTVKRHMNSPDQHKGHAQDKTETLTIMSSRETSSRMVHPLYAKSVSGRLRSLKEMFHIHAEKNASYEIAPYDGQADRIESNKIALMTPSLDILTGSIINVAEMHGFRRSEKCIDTYHLLRRTVPGH